MKRKPTINNALIDQYRVFVQALEELPDFVTLQHKKYRLNMTKEGQTWIVGYWDEDDLEVLRSVGNIIQVTNTRLDEAVIDILAILKTRKYIDNE